MCGLAAILSKQSSVQFNDLAKMIYSLRHRGPDDQGIEMLEKDRIGLAHVRLSIIDPKNGHQPMVDPEEGTTLVYTGEIYDCKKHRQKLVAQGYQFKTTSDTEVILKLYHLHGLEFFDKLNGEFALVIWDKRLKRLIAGRDRMGVKPLFYYENREEIVFSSEVKGLLSLGRHPIQPSAEFLQTSLMGMFVGRESFFEGIESVPPGSFLVNDSNGTSVKAYHRPQFEEKSNLSFDQAKEELVDLLQMAVKRRTQADVPVGLYLSAGVDSSIVAQLLSQVSPGATAFNMGFANQEFSESDEAKKTADALGLKYVQFETEPSEMADEIISTVGHVEIPISSPQPAAMKVLSRRIHEYGFKACMNGDGADELFGGYAFFKLDALRLARLNGEISKQTYQEKLKSFSSAEADNRITLWYPSDRWEKSLYRNQFVNSSYVRYQETRRFREKLLHPSILKSKSQADQSIEKMLGGFAESNLSAMNFSRRLSYQQLYQYVFPMQGDRVQMAHSVEVRTPFLDPSVIRWAEKLPADFLVNLATMKEKHILHEAFAPALPQHVRHQRKRAFHTGFSWRDFSTNPKGRAIWENYLSTEALRSSQIFNPGFVQLLKKINRWAPRQSDISKKIDLLLGGVFTSLLLMDRMKAIVREASNVEQVQSLRRANEIRVAPQASTPPEAQ